MAVDIGTKELSDCRIGNTKINEIYVGSTKVWPTKIVYTNDFIAFRYYRYGNAGQTPPYEIADIMAHNWSASGTWYQNLVVFQFTDAFFDKNPTTIFGNNGYYQDDGSGGRVKQGTLYRLNNSTNLSMEEVYSKYSYSTITNYCSVVTTIPGGSQYFNINVSTNFVRGGIYVIKLPDYSSGTYASCGLYHWNQSKFPCLYTRGSSSTGYNLIPQTGWLQQVPTQKWYMPRLITTVIDPYFINSSSVPVEELAQSLVVRISFLETNAKSEDMIPINKTVYDLFGEYPHVFESGEYPTRMQVVLQNVGSYNIVGLLAMHESWRNIPEAIVGKFHVQSNTIIARTIFDTADQYTWLDMAGENIHLFLFLAEETSGMGQAILNAQVQSPLIDYFA